MFKELQLIQLLSGTEYYKRCVTFMMTVSAYKYNSTITHCSFKLLIWTMQMQLPCNNDICFWVCIFKMKNFVLLFFATGRIYRPTDIFFHKSASIFRLDIHSIVFIQYTVS